MKSIRAVLGLGLLAALACGGPVRPLAWLCPEATPEPFWVEPIPAATRDTVVVVEVHIGHGERVSIVTESGVYHATGQFSETQPARVKVRLLGGVAHHLEVTARVADPGGPPGCRRGAYTMSTTLDKSGGPLAIEQVEVAAGEEK